MQHYRRALAIVEFVRGATAQDQAEVDRNRVRSWYNAWHQGIRALRTLGCCAGLCLVGSSTDHSGPCAGRCKSAWTFETKGQPCLQ